MAEGFFDQYKWWIIGIFVVTLAGFGFWWWWKNKSPSDGSGSASSPSQDARGQYEQWYAEQARKAYLEQQQGQMSGGQQQQQIPGVSPDDFAMGRLPAPTRVERPGTFKPADSLHPPQMGEPHGHMGSSHDLRGGLPPTINNPGPGAPVPQGGDGDFVDNPTQPYDGLDQLTDAFRDPENF